MKAATGLKICFVLAAGGLSPTGGFRIIAGYADQLQARGHAVTLVMPGGAPKRPPSLSGRIRAFVRGLLRPPPGRASFLKNPDVRIRIVPGVDRLAPSDLPDADVLIATWWETAEWIAAAPAHVAKAHFVQDHEIFPYLPVERARAVYRAPLEKIVVSQWLADEMREAYGKPSTLVENAVDFTEFNRGERDKPSRPTIGFVYSTALRKNSPMAIEACRRLRALYPELRVLAFGSHPPRKSDGMPPWVEFTLRPTAAEIAAIYGACDVWLFTSDEEGYGLPILEAMAAGTPVVATPAGAAPQIVNGANGVLVEHESAAVAAAAARIVNSSSDDWKTMSHAAEATALIRDWGAATDRFEAVLRAAAASAAR